MNAGIRQVTPEDDEVDAGQPQIRRALMRAAANVVDDLADRMREAMRRA